MIVSATGLPLIVGDFNFHVNVPTDRDAIAFTNMLSSFALHQHVQGPTHRNGNTLDLVLTLSDESIVSSAKATDHGFPDHWPVFVALTLEKPPLPRKTFTYRKLRDVSEANLRDQVKATDLCDPRLYNSLPIGDVVALYNNELKKCLDELAPLKQCTVTVRPHSKWYNDGIRTAKQMVRKKERVWRKTGLAVHRSIYMEERSRMHVLILEAKQTFYCESIRNCGNDTRKLFQLTAELVGDAGPGAPMVFTESSPDVAKMFSDFFIKKIEDIHSSIPPNDVPFPQMPPNNAVPLNTFKQLSIEAITCLIGRCGTKTCDLDPMPTNLLKLALTELAPIIRHIVNTSLQSGVFPEELKKALVIPRIKKSTLDPAQCASYRPVSNLSYLSKVLERAAAEQLAEHLESQHLLEPMQSAYRRKFSTETALVKIHDDVCRALGERKVVLLVMLDLSAAFDTVNHALLLSILESLKVTDVALEWFRSYLSDRHQVVCIQGSSSDPKSLKCGVPQGSVLGPLLFSVYTASLGHLLRQMNINYHLYADDSQIYLSVSPDQLADAVTKMEECVRSIKTWMSQHQLKMNDSKTEFIVLSNKRTAQKITAPTLNVSGHTIVPTASARNIGVTMDSEMTMEAHVNGICKRAYWQLHRIAKIRNFMDRESLECIIHAFMTSRIDYCNALLCGTSHRVTQKLQRVQNAAARILTKTKKSDHITPILRELHWLPVECRIEFKILVLTYKCVNDLAPPYLCQLVSPYVPPRNLRAADLQLLEVPFTTSDFVQTHAFSHTGPFLFNALPVAIRLSPSLTVFKKRVKTYLFNKFYQN
jgi:hypothetical protein